MRLENEQLCVGYLTKCNCIVCYAGFKELQVFRQQTDAEQAAAKLNEDPLSREDGAKTPWQVYRMKLEPVKPEDKELRSVGQILEEARLGRGLRKG